MGGLFPNYIGLFFVFVSCFFYFVTEYCFRLVIDITVGNDTD